MVFKHCIPAASILDVDFALDGAAEIESGTQPRDELAAEPIHETS